MPRVLNKRTDGLPSDAVYVGRPSRWGNPYLLGKDGDRETVVRRYRAWLVELLKDPEAAAELEELRGKNLVCWCAPEACHADVLLEVANG